MTTNERAQVEQVFGLTGGELSDDPWIIADEKGQDWTFHFYYDFPPEYAERQFDYTAHTYRTVVRDNMFGEPPDRFNGWTKKATFSNSGETECPYRNDPLTLVATETCPLCEALIGEEHGYIYIGDGWAEIVYQQVDIVKADPSDAGCYVDGHWGQYGVAHMVERAQEFGYYPILDEDDFSQREWDEDHPTGDSLCYSEYCSNQGECSTGRELA